MFTFDKTITVFTPCISKTETVWSKWVIPCCFYGMANVARFSDKDLYEENKIKVKIPVQDNYMEYSQWKELPPIERDNHFSISAFPNSLVFLGEIPEDIPDNRSGNDLLIKYAPNGIKVNSFKDNTGYFLEHYYLSGGWRHEH